MEANNRQETIHIFSMTDKDPIRMQEQHHELLLKQRLLSFNIIADFERISPHGLTTKENRK